MSFESECFPELRRDTADQLVDGQYVSRMILVGIADGKIEVHKLQPDQQTTRGESE